MVIGETRPKTWLERDFLHYSHQTENCFSPYLVEIWIFWLLGMKQNLTGNTIWEEMGEKQSYYQICFTVVFFPV